MQAQLDRLARIKKENELKNWQPAPVQPEVAFDDFLKLDLRVGTVKECKRVPKADKLLQFLIDDGTPRRTHHRERYSKILRSGRPRGQAGVLCGELRSAQAQGSGVAGYDSVGRECRRLACCDGSDRSRGSRRTGKIRRLQ